MPFNPEQPQVTAGVVLSGYFAQFADPLDWLAKGFGIATKVDRQQIAESLASTGGMGMATAEARGSDKTTRFRIEVVGKCEGKMVAQCRMTIDHRKMTYKTLEERAIDLCVLQEALVLGIQVTRGRQSDSLEGSVLEKDETFIRLFPLNVFNRAYFSAQITVMQKDRNVRVVDLGNSVLVELNKPWLFYDMPLPRKKLVNSGNLLPFMKA